MLRQPNMQSGWEANGWRGLLPELAPALFVVAMAPGYYWCRQRSDAAAGTWSASLVWAAMHAPVWPSPIPLFVLGLGFGVVAQRTQSLVPSVVAHSLFNGVACAQLLMMSQAAGP
jgi:hypothetical protein